MQTIIRVGTCVECPFFVSTTMSAIASLLAGKDDDRIIMGECDAPRESGLRHFKLGAPPTPEIERERERRHRRMRIFDASMRPNTCPLQNGPITVEGK